MKRGIEKPVRLGFVGCGLAGIKHIEILQEMDEAEIVAVCDKRVDVAKQAAERFSIPSYYEDAVRMMEEEKIDAVANITATAGHYPIAIEAAKRGLHVLMEKPLASTSEQSEELCNACANAGVLLAVTFTYRFVPEMCDMKKIIDSGELGKILEIRVLKYIGSPGKPPPGSDQRRQRDYLNTPENRGLLFDCGVHSFDLMCWYAGSAPLKIEAWGSHHAGYDYPDYATVLFEFENGIKGVYDDGLLTASRSFLGEGMPVMQIIAAGEKGSLFYSLGSKLNGGEYNKSRLDVFTEEGHRRKRYPFYSKCRDIQYEQFMKSVSSGKLEGHFPSPEEAVLATSVAERVLMSCGENRRFVKRNN